MPALSSVSSTPGDSRRSGETVWDCSLHGGDQRADLFTRLRAVLRLEDNEPTVKQLKNVQSALKRFTASLRRERPRRGPARDIRQAIDLILAHLDRHSPHLRPESSKLTRLPFR